MTERQWENEPDRWEFEHEGFPCILNRNGHGAWCGYVAVPPGHPWHGKDYDDIENVEVHGGLTYAEKCQGKICHEPKPGQPDNVWWLGFDCAHAGDLIPKMLSFNDNFLRQLSDTLCPAPHLDVYRDMDYVEAETKKLAVQAKAAA